jgi:hypothetical protein
MFSQSSNNGNIKTQAHDSRKLTCMSSTACSIIFSGSSKFCKMLFKLAWATFVNRSKRFMESTIELQLEGMGDRTTKAEPTKDDRDAVDAWGANAAAVVVDDEKASQRAAEVMYKRAMIVLKFFIRINTLDEKE